jgi:hypothetical protein
VVWFTSAVPLGILCEGFRIVMDGSLSAWRSALTKAAVVIGENRRRCLTLTQIVTIGPPKKAADFWGLRENLVVPPGLSSFDPLSQRSC